MAINTYPEPYRSRPKDSMTDPSTCYNRECTSYCAWKVKEATGSWLKRTGDMDAKNWIYRLPENGFRTRAGRHNRQSDLRKTNSLWLQRMKYEN